MITFPSLSLHPSSRIAAGRLRASVEIVATPDPDNQLKDLVDELAVRVGAAAMHMGVLVSIDAQIVDPLGSGP
jgi:hypothetical protein